MYFSKITLNFGIKLLYKRMCVCVCECVRVRVILNFSNSPRRPHSGYRSFNVLTVISEHQNRRELILQVQPRLVPTFDVTSYTDGHIHNILCIQ